MSFWARMFGKEAAEAELEPVAPAPAPEPEPTPEPEPEPPTVEHVAVVREPEPEPELAVPEVAPEPRRAVAPTGEITEDELETLLTALLDSLGSAHRRPFVRNG
jgi:hypothetical protein